VIVESEALYARHEMLEELTNYECTEMSDAIERLAGAARTLIGLGDYPNAQLALINYFSPYDKMSKDTFDGRE
jgi:hypothetical protein